MCEIEENRTKRAQVCSFILKDTYRRKDTEVWKILEVGGGGKKLCLKHVRIFIGYLFKVFKRGATFEPHSEYNLFYALIFFLILSISVVYWF